MAKMREIVMGVTRALQIVRTVCQGDREGEEGVEGMSA